jgi:DNA-binding XRE family transcriptional regulator
VGTKLSDYITEVEAGADERRRESLRQNAARFSIAAQLLRLRLDHDLTQSRLAEVTGIAQGDISRYERGIGNPTVDQLERLGAALGAHVELVRDDSREPVGA